MNDFRNKNIIVEYEGEVVCVIEIDNEYKYIPSDDFIWDAEVEEFQIKNTKGITYKGYEIPYFFISVDLEDVLPDDFQKDVHMHAQALIKIDDEDDCYYDYNKQTFLYFGLNDFEECSTWEEVLKIAANKTVAIRTIKYMD